MVDSIKGCTEINLHDLSLVPTLQCTLHCMEHAQKCITCTQTFPISKLGGWKHTTAFHKSSKTNRHQALEHLRQYWCYGNLSVIGTEQDGGPFVIGVTLAFLQQAGKLPRWTSRRNTILWRGAIASSVLLRKRGNIPNWSVPIDLTRPDFTRPEGKGGKTMRWMASERQTPDSLGFLLSALATDSHNTPPPSPTSVGNDELEPNTAVLRVTTTYEGTRHP